MMGIKEAIQEVIKGNSLSEDEMAGVFEQIMSGGATDAQIGSFLTALRLKGETVEEITGAARIMRKKATKLKVKTAVNINEETVIDTCGTGGSGTNTFNVSTISAFVVAGCGAKVAKHGNRSVSSQCGSADVLKELGVNIDLSPEKVADCVKKIGIGFLYAPLYHGAMKYAIGPRREIGIRTIFNVLGPLTNPAGADSQIIGVYDESLTEVIARVLKNLGTRRAFVVHGLDGLDEITVTSGTKVSELRDNKIQTYCIKPEDFGIPRSTLNDIRGKDAKVNAEIALNVLSGEKGPKRDIVLLNSAAALTAASKTDDIQAGIKIAEESIDSQQAINKLNQLKKVSNEL